MTVYRGFYPKQRFYLPTELNKRPPCVAILSQFETTHDDINNKIKYRKQII
jgi:hypothetical protein